MISVIQRKAYETLILTAFWEVFEVIQTFWACCHQTGHPEVLSVIRHSSLLHKSQIQLFNKNLSLYTSLCVQLCFVFFWLNLIISSTAPDVFYFVMSSLWLNVKYFLTSSSRTVIIFTSGHLGRLDKETQWLDICGLISMEMSRLVDSSAFVKCISKMYSYKSPLLNPALSCIW